MNSKIIVALDYSSKMEALNFVDKISDPSLCRLKIGKELFTTAGIQIVKELHKRKYEVFLDLKFHDIPNTVTKAIQASADLGVWMIDVHATGGLKMMTQAKIILEKYGKDAPILIAVTVLTSMQQQDLSDIGINMLLSEYVIHLAKLVKKANLDGVVCSGQEAALLRKQFGDNFKLITPGIRPDGNSKGDQARTITPQKAIQMGADYLVIGRPITLAENPVTMLQEINRELMED